MKTLKLLAAVVLALAALLGLILALKGPPVVAHQQDAGSSISAQALPTPYLNSPEVVDAPFDNPPSPNVDGLIAPGEYAGAGKVTFPGHGGDVEVFFKEDGTYLYVAFDVPLFDLSGGSTYVDVYLDTDHDHTMDQTDYQLRVRDDGVTREYTPTVSGLWGGEKSAVNWTAAMTTSLIGGGWQVEYRIDYTKLGVAAGTYKELGLALGTVNGGSYYWPPDAYATDLSLWGSLVSSSDWGTFYWKPGPWEDYAPSGMPDFDQRQAGWFFPTAAISTHCGPVAMANSLWWFDSKFETLTGTMPPVVSDTYRLVTSYAGGDDHDPANVIPFVDDLANAYFNTNDVWGGGTWMGTYVTDMHSGTIQYLRDHGLWDDYIVTLVEQPDFDWVADEVMRSEDVILLLGFYEEQEIPPGSGIYEWVRVGGHYVNVAGVDPVLNWIAFSDPYVDAFEQGLAPIGRMLTGTLNLPHTPGHTFDWHNDAGNVSHDIYPIVPTTSPGGHWGPDPAIYPWFLFEPWFIAPPPGVNPHPGIFNGPYVGTGIVQVEVEYALAVSPYTWKSSGYWEEDAADPVRGTWQPWVDYAINGVPDIDQRQDNWGVGPAPGDPNWQWTFCGPAAAANSLWWFDAKFEPSPVGPLMPPYQPMPFSDNYPMVWSYDPTGLWDDHDPLNVDDPATPWPPPGWPPPWPPGPIPPGTGELVEDLAQYFMTDQPPPLGKGTVITNMYNGIDQYLIDHGLRAGYVITQVKSPDFWWVTEEVERSEDVILLMGFWQWQDTQWVRLGGHYVTVPGVDKQGGFVAFSDPYYDGAGYNWPYAYPTGWPTVMGRLTDGWLITHTKYHLPDVHNDAGNLSHDVYYVAPTDSPGGVWGPLGYVEGGWPSVEPFWGQNGNENPEPSVTADPIQAEVDWAIAVSPVADVWVDKDFDPLTASPGDTVTITIRFGNDGSLPAEGVVITDILPSELGSATWSYWTSNGLTVTARPGVTYAWDVPDLAWMEWGLITVTAQVSPDLRSDVVVTNTAQITTSSVEQYQLTPLPNTASDSLTVDVTYGVDLTPATSDKSGDNGASVVHAFSVQNTGNVPDSFTVAVAGDDWPTTVAPASVGPLNPGVSATVQVTVTVPVSAFGSTYDQATITAQSVASATVSDTSALTTTATPSYTMHQDPASASKTGGLGQMMTYVLSIHNDGNITDTYDVTYTLGSWTTSLSASSVGPVAPGGSADYDVYVSIPEDASNGDFDVVTVTATSQASPAASDSSVLTTTATTQTIVYGVTVEPSSATGDGDPGDTVTYTLRVTNTGNVADTFSLGYTGPSTWTVSLSSAVLSLGAGAGTSVEVYVGIPSGATAGSSGVVTATVTSQAWPAATDSSVLTTYVSRRFIYLPIVLRNYP